MGTVAGRVVWMLRSASTKRPLQIERRLALKNHLHWIQTPPVGEQCCVAFFLNLDLCSRGSETKPIGERVSASSCSVQGVSIEFTVFI
mmetsp:Transcript_12158/g.23521  ORF Transcript_12158/g.23521 Transcript_12158/m.23521 type:complete len:88 (-) Transcript_12158:11-274(-)